MSVTLTSVPETPRQQPAADQAAVVVHDTAESAMVALYTSHENAEQAVRVLHKAGFDMTRLSIVGKDFQTDQQVVGFYNKGDRMKAWGERGVFWGAVWGLLFGSAFFLVPGVGPLFAAGPVVVWIVGALEGAVIVGGMSVLSAALCSAGIPQDSVLKYEAQIKAGHYVIIAHGSKTERQRMRAALEPTGHAGLIDHS